MNAKSATGALLCWGLLLVGISTAQPQDNGIPASKAQDFEQVYKPTTGSEWRTYKEKSTGREVSFNPKTSELWFNPVSKKYEPVLREEGSPNPEENSVTRLNGGSGSVQKTEKVFNPVTKKFEDVVVEAGPAVNQNGSPIQYPQSLDNGLPASTADNWKEVVNDKTGSEWRTYENKKTGQVVEFNPKTSELWFNPVKKKWEPVMREPAEQQSYIKGVAREMIWAGKPKGATGWRCNFSGTIHSSPDECEDPDQGGEWVQ